MILQALVNYYDILSEDPESGISKEGYSKAKISYALNISKEGNLLEVLPLKQEVQKGKKKVEIPLEDIVPEQIKKTVGIASNFLCENASYTLGLYKIEEADSDKEKEKKKYRSLKCFEAFRELHSKILENETCEESRAVIAFVNSWDCSTALENEVLSPYLEELLKGVNVVLKLDGGDFIHKNKKIQSAWEKYKDNDSDGIKMQCLVTGENTVIERLNPAIRGIRGAQSAGASLVSFNATAYESYGKDKMQGLNAPIGKKAAFAYGTVLKELVSDRNHSINLGDATVVYWAQSTKKVYSDIAALFFEPDDLEEGEERPKRDLDASKIVGSVFEKISNGIAMDGFEGLDGDVSFYVIGISPNAARLSIRFFIQDSFGGFVKKITKHYEDMRIEKEYKDNKDYISLWRILNQTVSPNAKEKSSSPLLSGSVLRSIIEGRPYPESLFSQIIIRIRAERNINYEKAAIIKAYLLRKNKYTEVLTMSLNQESENVSYLLGRLFAVLEKVQIDANGSSTIKDRYFSSASSTPSVVFPVLLKTAQHHISKSKNGGYMEKHISEIMEKMDIISNPIPSNLSLEEQGVFILGYYHQRNNLYKKKEEKAAE